MSAVDDFITSAATGNKAPTLDGDIERDHYGRYLILTEDGLKNVPHTRATTVAKTLSDTYNLEQWGKRMAAIGLTRRPDLFARVASIDPEDKKTLNAVLEEAQEAAEASVGRNLGTALHSFTERLDRGDDVSTTPAPWNADLVAYREEMVRAGVRIVPDMIERVVVCEALSVAGTFDRLVTIPGQDLPLVADLKTAKEIFDWLQILIQLAIYAGADFIYNPKTKTREPMPQVNQDWALVMHLPPGKACCTLYLLNIGQAREAVELAMSTREWRKRSDRLVVELGELQAAIDGYADLGTLLGQSIDQPAPDVEGLQRPALDPAVIDMANTGLRRRLGDVVKAGVPSTMVIWPAGVPTFKEGGPTTWAQVKAVEALLEKLDAEMGMPFVERLPDDPTVAKAIGDPSIGIAGADQVAPVYPIERPDPAVLEDLRDRNALLPPDLRQRALDMAREAGVPGRHLEWTAFHVKTIEEAIASCEIVATARLSDVKAALGEFEADQVLGILTCAGHEQGSHVDELEAVRIVAIARAVDSGALGLALNDDGLHVVQCNDAVAETALLFAHSTKTAVVAAAKTAAALHGRPKPRSTAEVVADPVLVAVLTAEDSTSNQQPESENPNE